MTTTIDSPTECAVAPLRIIGRTARFMTGAAQLWFVYILFTNPGIITAPNAPSNLSYWIPVGLAFALLSWTVNLAFGMKWGKWPSLIAAAVGFAAVGIDIAMYDSFWGVPLAAVVTVVSVYVHGHMGIGHVIAGIVATPGCEMKAIPHLISIVRGSSSQFVACPGVWAPLDRIEARLWSRTLAAPEQ
ncbi:MAG: hypothetical protein VCB26_11170 [Candidatus Hydrogenedentota bacterium]